MPKITAAAAALLLVLVLAGCGDDGATGDASSEQSKPTAQEEATATREPLVAETPRALEGEEAEAAFITAVRERLAKIQSQIPDATDEQLIASAHEACDRLEAGESGENMTLIEGEQMTNGYYMDSGAIIIAARLTMCPLSQ